MRSATLVPSSARYMLSAANMLLKLNDETSVAHAVALYEEVASLDTITTPLTPYQRAMCQEKLGQARLAQSSPRRASWRCDVSGGEAGEECGSG